MTNTLTKSHKKNNTSLNTLILFFTVFSINLQGFLIKPRFIVMTFVLVITFINIFITKKNKMIIRKKDFFWFLFLLFLLVYSIIIVSFNVVWNQYNAFDDTLNFLIFVGIYPIFLQTFFTDEFEFCQALTYATTLHSVIVILSFLSTNFRFILESVQAISFARYSYRIIGLGIAGAGGSVYLSVGLIACIYQLLFYKHNKTTNKISLFFIIIATLLVGRTGLYVAVALFFYIIFFHSSNIYSNLKNGFKMISTLVIILVLLLSLVNIMNLEINDNLFRYTYSRAFELFKGAETLDALSAMNQRIPELTNETFFGTGITRGRTTTGLNIQHDGGYIKRYVSIGLLMAILSYIGFIVYNISNFSKMNKRKKHFMYFALMLLLIIEYKEPFVYMLAYPFVLIMISNLYYKHEYIRM